MRTRRLAAAGAATALLAGLVVATVPVTSTASPVATNETLYQLYGRVFPDPHGCLPRTAPWSPFAKGNVCAADFIQFGEMVEGLEFLNQKFPGFVQLARVDEMLGHPDDPDYMSAGLAKPDLTRAHEPLWIVRVTDERVPDTNKKHYVFPLSIHGIERAGVEGGVRAIEDLATWGATEPAHPILEASPDVSIGAGEALKKTASYFVFANPDGWRRGDRDNGFSYQRYNGNGVDLNRDWPAIGYTFEPYTPWSEPESRALGEALKKIRAKWDGGIDLHGQNNARAFSFTLLGAGQNDFGKNQATMDIVQGAWADAEKRLAWSPIIKPNTADASDPRVYGVQWGTVWDTIAYTVTGAFGDWINQPLGLDAIGIDNEMSFSHLYNCGTGTCFLPDIAQLHVDGNKSLIYSMINFGLKPEDRTFRFPGKAAYLAGLPHVSSPAKLRAAGSAVAGLQPQADIALELTPANQWTQEFDVQGLSAKVHNGGIRVDARAVNAGAVSPSAATATLLIERREKDGEWETVSSYFNQSPVYVQAGQTVAVNDPEPGRWRVRIQSGTAGVVWQATVDFRHGSGWPNPGQLAYDATNERFFTDLNKYAQTPLDGILADQVISGAADLSRYDTFVVADQILPGFVEPLPSGPAQDTITFDMSLAVAAPCGAARTDVPCASVHEWDVDAAKNNRSMAVTLDWDTGVDWDLYIDRQVDGAWTQVAQAAGSARPEVATVAQPLPGRYRARAVNWAAGPLPTKLEVAFSNAGPQPRPGTRTRADAEAFAARLRSFVEKGGNLVLTDGAVRLLAYMNVVPRDAVRQIDQYAGYIAFSVDGGATATYDDPLARNVQRPGAAEGPGHRHQIYDPGPLGFSFDENAAPNWTVERSAWEKAGGRSVGVTTAGNVSLGELGLGKGKVRIIGALLPTPTDRYFHPYGLSDYSITYSGYQLIQNALGYKAPARSSVKGAVAKPPLPATGVDGPLLAGMGLLAAAVLLRRWRGRAA